MPVLPILVLTGCERAKSSNPLSPSIAGPIAGVSIDPPKALIPVGASQIPVDKQPITLMIENASSSGVRPLKYIFEVGTDVDFTQIVFTQKAVEPGPDGHTTLKLSEALSAERSYFWRVKADDGANASEYSAPLSFRVYTPVVIQAPGLVEPADDAKVVARRPTFVLANAERTGPAGTIQYLLEVASDEALTNKVLSVLVKEGSNHTSFLATDDLAYATRVLLAGQGDGPGARKPLLRRPLVLHAGGPAAARDCAGAWPLARAFAGPDAQWVVQSAESRLPEQPARCGLMGPDGPDHERHVHFERHARRFRHATGAR